MTPILNLLAAKHNELIDAMFGVILPFSYHDLRAMLPAAACRSLLWDHVVCRNLWTEFENALKTINMHESVWQQFFNTD